MSVEKIIHELDALPPEGQRQVADFVAFLQARHKHLRPRKTASKKKLAEEPFIGLWEHRKDLEDSSLWVRRTRQKEWESYFPRSQALHGSAQQKALPHTKYCMRNPVGSSHYKTIEEGMTYFATTSTVNWLPLFAIPDLTHIVPDAMRFLHDQGRITFHGLCFDGKPCLVLNSAIPEQG